MAKGGSTSVEVPKFNQPARTNFATPFGQVVFNPGTNTFEFQENAGQAQQRSDTEAIRATILKGLGITSPQREQSRKEFQDTFFKESKRLALPQLENTLFERGLGGETPFFRESVNDLLSKLAVQSILQKEGLALQDEQLKLSQLGGVQNVLGQNQGNILNLLALASGFNTNQDQLATSRFQSTLPFETKVKKKSGFPVGTLVGLGVGGLTGGFALPALGALGGAKLGAGIGGIFDK